LPNACGPAERVSMSALPARRIPSVLKSWLAGDFTAHREAPERAGEATRSATLSGR
jgi:hypothetical protein